VIRTSASLTIRMLLVSALRNAGSLVRSAAVENPAVLGSRVQRAVLIPWVENARASLLLAARRARQLFPDGTCRSRFSATGRPWQSRPESRTRFNRSRSLTMSGSRASFSNLGCDLELGSCFSAAERTIEDRRSCRAPSLPSRWRICCMPLLLEAFGLRLVTGAQMASFWDDILPLLERDGVMRSR